MMHRQTFRESIHIHKINTVKSFFKSHFLPSGNKSYQGKDPVKDAVNPSNPIVQRAPRRYPG
ncbi:hypothetical protein ACRRTK_010822 [Alexandromys fortis]